MAGRGHTLKNVLREPLAHFLLIGAGLFLLFDRRGGPPTLPPGQAGAPATQIVVTSDAVDQMSSQFAKTWQRPPTEEERRGLVEELVRNEIFYREAVAAGLDRDDEVLKRRLRQKMEFIYEDISSLTEPADADLAAHLGRNREKYLLDPQLAFRQVFISTQRSEPQAEARRALAQLAAGADPDALGDPSMLQPEVPLSPLWDIRKQFGDEFGSSLLEARPGSWTGPLRSGFGLHLVLVKERREGRLPDLSEVRERVKQDWMARRQQELKDAAYAKLRERYSVIVEQPKAAAAASTEATTR